MVRLRYFGLFITISILSSCAQIGILTGGPIDETAPIPIMDKTKPKNGATNFNGQEIRLYFDEYIELNNVNQTLQFIPNDAKPTAKIKGKSVVINWDDTLKANTTYKIAMQGMLRDITEKNDTILFFVFSTGSQLDSLSFQVQVLDAFNDKAAHNKLAGLFFEERDIKPMYFALTDQNGKATFQFVKPGNYYIRAFDDLNKNLQMDKDEMMGFRDEIVRLEFSKVDTIPIRIFQPPSQKKNHKLQYQHPKGILLSSNYSLVDSKVYLNGIEVPIEAMNFLDKDSLLIYTSIKSSSTQEIVMEHSDGKDSLQLKVTEKELTSKVNTKPQLIKNAIGPNQNLQFSFSDRIVKVDPLKIVLIDTLNQQNKIPFTYEFFNTELIIKVDKNEFSPNQCKFQFGAIELQNSLFSDSSSNNIEMIPGENFGIITVNLEAFTEAIVVEILQKDKLVESVKIKGEKSLDFRNLTPGEYSFRVIDDKNENGIWDTGNWFLNQQAEYVYWFRTPVRARANWEVSIELKPNK